jgi:general stress protein YciG
MDKRGFGAMDPDRQRELATKGGRNVPAKLRSFSQNRGLAADAGRKGGAMVNPANRSFSKNRALAAEAGRKGGRARHRKRCPLRTTHGERICIDGVVWELTYSEMAPPDQRQAAGDCPHCAGSR